MTLKAVDAVKNVITRRAEERKNHSLADQVKELIHSAHVPAIVTEHGFSKEDLKLGLEKATQRLLGIEGPLGEQHADGRQALASLSAPFPKDLLPAATRSWDDGIPKRSPQERAKLDGEMADAIKLVQAAFAKKELRGLERGQHAKANLGIPNARFEVRPDLPRELQFGPFKAGADWRTLIRFSNAPSSVASDLGEARRGIALRFTDDQGHSQDLLMTTGSPAFLAKDGPAAVTAAKAEAAGALGLLDLAKQLGPKDAAKLLFAAKTTDAKNESLAASTFFSRVPFQLGDYAVKFRLVPLETDATIRGPKGDDQLTDDMQARMKAGEITYVLEAQLNRNPQDLGDARIDWDSPYVALGKITIPRQDVSDATVAKGIETVNGLSFKPWNRWDDGDDRAMKPLGDVNEARKAIYEASSRNRGSGGVNDKRCPLGYG